VFTRPDDVDEGALMSTISQLWGIDVAEISYAPLGFGSHHWVGSGTRGRWFVTVNHLAACLNGELDSHDAAFARLERAFRCARLLATEGALGFVVAPIPALDGRTLYRFDEGYSVVLHPFIEGESADDGDGGYRTDEDRHAVVAVVGDLHAATALVQDVATWDDLKVPLRESLVDALTRVGMAWDTGPYGGNARALLDRHAGDVERLLDAFDSLAARVAAEPERYVMTHGEPGAQNVMIVDGDYCLIDWESARLAAPERDLWDLDPGDGCVIAAYQARTGTEVRPFALDAYRLWYDLFEIAGYIEIFRNPHAASADAAESWKNLQYFLRPRERWPQLL
jgi:Phosphotransferase enzyme family